MSFVLFFRSQIPVLPITGTTKLMDIKGADTKYPLYIGVSIKKG